VGDVRCRRAAREIWIDDIRLYLPLRRADHLDAALASNSSGDFKGQFDTLLAR
jgi:hypothetical protein